MAEKAAATKTALEPVPVKTLTLEGFDRIFDAITRRAFQIFESRGGIFGRELDDWLKAESEFLHPVKLNMTESDDSFRVEAEVPGFTAKDLQVQIEAGRLTISGKRETTEEQKKGKQVYQEHRANEILRVVDFPSEVDVSKATATLKNGMLELQVPKSEKAKGMGIEVKPA
jgi:HSP20 family protein